MVETAIQFAKFASVGAVGTLAHYMVLIVAVELWQADAVLASSAGALAGASVNYVLNYSFTFASTKRHRDALPKFLLVASVGFILNGLLMTLITGVFQVMYLFAQFGTTISVLLWNYVGNRLWTFRHSPRS
jgi:putative flippase GtrA